MLIQRQSLLLLALALPCGVFASGVTPGDFCGGLILQAPDNAMSGGARGPSRPAAERVADDFELFLVIQSKEGTGPRLPTSNLYESMPFGTESSLRQRISRVQYDPAFLNRLSAETRHFIEGNRAGTHRPRAGDATASKEFMKFLKGLRKKGETLRLPSIKIKSEQSLAMKLRMRRKNPEFLAGLSAEAKHLIEQNTTLRDVQGPTQAAIDLDAYLKELSQAGKPARLPKENALTARVRLYRDNPHFLEKLSPEAKSLLAKAKAEKTTAGPVATLDAFFAERKRLPTAAYHRRNSVELSEAQSREARAYRAMLKIWHSEELFKALEEPTRNALSLDFQQTEPRNGIQGRVRAHSSAGRLNDSTQRLVAFVETHGHLPRSHSPRKGQSTLAPEQNEENNLYHCIYRNSENEKFLNALPEHVRKLVEAWSEEESNFEYVGPDASAERLAFFYRNNGNRLPKGSVEGEERALYARMYYYCENLEFLEALPVSIAREVIQWRHTIYRAPSPNPEELAEEITRFYRSQKELPKSQYRKGSFPTGAKRQETVLYSRLSYRVSNENFLNLLPEDVRTAVREWRANIAPRGPVVAAARTVAFWDSHNHRLPTRPQSDGVGGNEWNMYYLVRNHWEKEEFLDALPDQIKLQVIEWRDYTYFGAARPAPYR